MASSPPASPRSPTSTMSAGVAVEGDSFVVTLTKPMGIQVAETGMGPIIAVIDSPEAGGSAHKWNLAADTDHHVISVGDVIKAVNNSKNTTMISLKGKKIHEVMDLIDRAGASIKLELFHTAASASATGASSGDTDLVKEGITTRAAERLQKADRFKVALSKPLGIKIGESEDGIMIAQIEAKGAALEWNKIAEGDEFSHNIAVGDIVISASNKKGEMVSFRDMTIDKVMDFFAKSDKKVKLEFARLNDVSNDVVAVKRMISRHNTRSLLKKRPEEEEEDDNADSDRYDCTGYNHPAGAIVDVYPLSCCIIGTLLGPCGVYYGLTHGMKKCRKCDAVWSAAPGAWKADARHVRSANANS